MASFRKRGKNWEYRIRFKDKDGKHKEYSKGGFSTKVEAKTAATKAENELLKGNNLSENPIFIEYMNHWYETYRKDKHSAKNNKDIQFTMNVAKRYFKQTKIKEINRASYQSFINWYGKDHATATVKKVHIYVKACLLDALDDGLIFKDPTRNIVVKGNVPKKEEALKFISKDETIALLKEIVDGLQPNRQSRYIILIGLTTGMRFSEILALKWSDIDFDKQTISINKSYDHMVSKEIKETKSETSNRVISINKDVLSHLKRYKLFKQMSYDEFLFIDQHGHTVSNNAVNKALKRACERLGIKQITFHSLRHAHCSLLIYEGLDIQYISKRLGHSSTSITYDVYGHIIDEMKDKENEKLETVLNELMG